MHLRYILEPNHMHQRHPQTHNMKTEEDMKTEEGEGQPRHSNLLPRPPVTLTPAHLSCYWTVTQYGEPEGNRGEVEG